MTDNSDYSDILKLTKTPRTGAEIAKAMGRNVPAIRYHLRPLLASGHIVHYYCKKRNTNIYERTKKPYKKGDVVPLKRTLKAPIQRDWTDFLVEMAEPKSTHEMASILKVKVMSARYVVQPIVESGHLKTYRDPKNKSRSMYVATGKKYVSPRPQPVDDKPYRRVFRRHKHDYSSPVSLMAEPWL
jgi:predicted ArsR family transcriptional regulator